MDERLIIVGADVGNGYTKIDLGDSLQFQIPSLVSHGKERNLAVLMENYTNPNDLDAQMIIMDIKIHDHQKDTVEHFFCGELALSEGTSLNQWDDDKGASNGSRALLLSSIALGLKEQQAIVYLSASLPVKNFSRYKKSYEENIAGDYTVEFCSGPMKGLSKRIKILRCRVYPEGLGVYILELHERKKTFLSQGIHAIIAPGFRTTEFLLFRNGKPVDDLSGSLEFGIASAHKHVAKHLSDTYGMDYSEHEIDILFREDLQVTIRRGEKLRVKEVCENEFRSLSDLIVAKLRIKWQDVWKQLESIMVSDGGGLVVFNNGLQDKLISSTDAEIYLVDNAPFANAMGNRTAAVIALGGSKYGNG
ncbi:MAG: ParM/StbA family protein [Bacillota bacterium]